MNVFLFFFKVR